MDSCNPLWQPTVEALHRQAERRDDLLEVIEGRINRPDGSRTSLLALSLPSIDRSNRHADGIGKILLGESLRLSPGGDSFADAHPRKLIELITHVKLGTNSTNGPL